jgi:hypothetical protein
MLGVGSAVGRLIFGPIADKFGRFSVYRLTVLFDVIILALWPACTTEASVIAFAFFYGMFGGGFAAMFAVVAAELWGPERLSGFFTLVNLVSIPGAFAAGPLVGAIIQITGTYDAAIGFTAGMMGMSFLFVMMVKKEPLPASPHHQSREQASATGPPPPIGTSALDDLILNNDDDIEAQPPKQRIEGDYANALLLKYNVSPDELEHASDAERETYIRAVQLVRFREAFPDSPEDVFTRALNALRENPFEVLKGKVYEKFGKVPDEWDYQEMMTT